jgi:DNA-binding response OmpR family regulator
VPQPLSRTEQKKRVLVVEDDVDASIIYAATLEHAGFDVATAGTLKEAAAAVRERRPSIVVLDCNLPDGNGLTLLASWKRSSEMASMPVVIVTAFADPEHVDAASEAGADAFMVKPCVGEALTSFLTRVLAASKPTRPVLRLRMSERFSPPILFPSGQPTETATLHRIDDTHFHAQCGSCHRSSPVVQGNVHDVLRRVVALGWSTGRTGAWTCPICQSRPSRAPAK